MKVQDVSVDIALAEPGVYCLGFDGATGKTYLYTLLNAYSKQHENEVLAITYDTRFKEDIIISLIKSFTGKIMILDRFDLYCTDKIISVLNAKDNTIILLDLKSNIVWQKLPIKFTRIKMDKNSIEVTSRW